MDEQALEERLVPLAAQVAGRLAVSALAVGEQIERLVERGLDLAEGLLGGLEVSLGLRDLAREPVLLLAEQVDGHGTRVVGVEELLALAGELCAPAALTGRLLLGLLAHAGEGLVELRACELRLHRRKADVRVGILDRPLDELDRHVGLLATGTAHACDAEEVGVGAAVSLRVDQAHARAAAPAVKRALQVVMVLSVLLGGVVVGGEDGLDASEGAAVDEPLVAALVLDAGVADGADVVGVLEQGGELRA